MRRLVPRILVLPTLAFAALTASAPSLADTDNTARWATIIGIVQANNVVGVVQGGGQPWSTLGGNVTVDLAHGRIDFDVRGLVFAGGNAIGTPGPITHVKGTLVCDVDGSGGAAALVDTPLVTLDDEGNARFHGSVGALPAPCTSEPDIAFLIRIPAGRWIANGAVLR